MKHSVVAMPIWRYFRTRAVSLSFAPLSLVCVPIGIGANTVAMPMIFTVLSLTHTRTRSMIGLFRSCSTYVLSSIGPCENAVTMPFILLEMSLIRRSVRPCFKAFAMHSILTPFSHVRSTVGPTIRSLTMFLSFTIQVTFVRDRLRVSQPDFHMGLTPKWL